MSKWQLCPKCNGQGIVSKPPHIAGDVYQWTSTECTFQCDVCNGAKVLLVPDECNAYEPIPKIQTYLDEVPNN